MLARRTVAIGLRLTMLEGLGDDTKFSPIPTNPEMAMKIVSTLFEDNGD